MSGLGDYFSRLSDEDKILAAHISDMSDICEKSRKPRFSNFLDERQAALAVSVLNGLGFKRYCFYGGYEGASRRVLGVFPDYFDTDSIDSEELYGEFPISAVVFKYRESDRLTHRDFLGAFMSRQIKREMLGDIAVSAGSAAVFVCGTVKEVLLSEITKVGSVGVKASEEDCRHIEIKQEFAEKGGSVSSLRLDSVLALAAGISRGKAADLIKGGNVSVKYEVVESASRVLEEGDVFSARGYGKFLLYAIG